MITGDTTIGRLLDAHPELVEVLARYHPHFEKLRFGLLRKIGKDFLFQLQRVGDRLLGRLLISSCGQRHSQVVLGHDLGITHVAGRSDQRTNRHGTGGQLVASDDERDPGPAAVGGLPGGRFRLTFRRFAQGRLSDLIQLPL